MNVGELKKIIAHLPADMEILVAADEEGNSYHKLRVAEKAKSFGGSYVFEVAHPDDIKENPDWYSDWKDRLVLWP